MEKRSEKQYKKLPFEIEAIIKTECWTYFKWGIIQSSKLGESWIASNFRIYIDNEYKVYFGDASVKLYMHDFRDILDFEEVDYWSVSSEEIVDIIKHNILDNKYMIVYLIYNNSLHDFLFYGFDDEKQQFIIPNVVNGRFEEFNISYEEVQNTYEEFRQVNIKDPDLWLIINANFYPITRITLKENYNTEDCYYAVIERFMEEVDGKKYSIQKYNENKKIFCSDSLFTGIACLLAMEERVYQYIRDKKYITGTVFEKLSKELNLNFNKLSEHRYAVFLSMKWFSKRYDKINKDIYFCIKEYEKCCVNMRRISNLAMVFEQNEEWDCIYRIQNLLKSQYEKEKMILSLFLELIVKENIKVKIYGKEIKNKYLL